MRTKYRQPSSQYVFGYQKFILMPEDYKATNSGKVNVKLPEVVGKGYGTFWRWKGRYRAVKGSRASKKSKTTALWYITNMMKYPDANTLVVRKTYRTLKDSCFTELKWAIHRLGVDAFWDIKESPLEMTYKPTGQKIYFRGLDDPLKVTSITVDQGVLCWMWIEEAYEISSEDDFNMLDESIRGAIPEGSDLFKQITVTFNPWNEHHWLKKRFFDNPDDETLALTTNYKCNEWLDKADLKVFETMRKQNPRRYAVAGLGDWGIVDGLVYENWHEEAFTLEQIRQQYSIDSAFGLDFGYTNDPSGSDGFVFSDVPELQSELDARFNNNDDFIDELSETLTDCQTKGFAYMYAMKDSTDKLKFTCADSIGVVEVEARFAEDKKDHVIYWYVDRVDKEGHRIKKIMDWDDEQVVYYVQTDEGEIQLDDKAKVNPRPHILYQVDGDDNTYIDSLGFLPFFRLDNNKKQFSNLKAVKDLIDDYDLTHIFLCDFADLKAVGVASDTARMIINGEVYEILMIDDPMNMHEHLEIT